MFCSHSTGVVGGVTADAALTDAVEAAGRVAAWERAVGWRRVFAVHSGGVRAGAGAATGAGAGAGANRAAVLGRVR